MRRLRPVERLCERLYAEHKVQIDLRTFDRTRAGYWQRSSGAWSWFAMTRDRQEIGSQFSVTQLLKCKALTADANRFGQIEVDPVDFPLPKKK